MGNGAGEFGSWQELHSFLQDKAAQEVSQVSEEVTDVNDKNGEAGEKGTEARFTRLTNLTKESLASVRASATNTYNTDLATRGRWKAVFFGLSFSSCCDPTQFCCCDCRRCLFLPPKFPCCCCCCCRSHCCCSSLLGEMPRPGNHCAGEACVAACGKLATPRRLEAHEGGKTHSNFC